MLTDTAVRKAKPADKSYKLSDSAGLHVFITPAGGKLWRYRYEFGGKEKLLSLGPYPAVSLVEARTARDDARKILRAGKDPSLTRRLEKLAKSTSSATTFEAVAREWHALQKSGWVERHAFDVLDSLERQVFSELGAAPIRDITASEVIAVLRKIEERGAKETARRVRQRMSSVFVYAIATGRAEADPAAVVQKAMAPIKKGRFPAIVDLDVARAMLAKVEAEHAHPVTKLAMRILALTAVRPGALVETPWPEWVELDGKEPTWRIPAARMKLKLQHKDDEARDHFVPLARQSVEAIEALRRISGRGPLAFPNTRHAHKPMSANALGYLLNRAGYHHRHCPHGWRSTFSTVMNERHRADRELIDMMLAHVQDEETEAAYNRAEYRARRRELAQEWADLILQGAKPAEELLLGRRR